MDNVSKSFFAVSLVLFFNFSALAEAPTSLLVPETFYVINISAPTSRTSSNALPSVPLSPLVISISIQDDKTGIEYSHTRADVRYQEKSTFQLSYPASLNTSLGDFYIDLQVFDPNTDLSDNFFCSIPANTSGPYQVDLSVPGCTVKVDY